MKRVLLQGILVLGVAAAGLPVLAQQAPINAPNPSAAPENGQPGADRNMSGGQMGGMSQSGSTSGMSKSKNTHRADKPRQQDAPRAPRPDAPSGPKGDSPDPAPKQ